MTTGSNPPETADHENRIQDEDESPHGPQDEDVRTGFEDEESGDEHAPGTSSLNPLQVVGSVLAAGLGVQSSRNRERDFKQGRAGIFIVAGLVFTALFIGGVYTVVTLVLASR